MTQSDRTARITQSVMDLLFAAARVAVCQDPSATRAKSRPLTIVIMALNASPDAAQIMFAHPSFNAWRRAQLTWIAVLNLAVPSAIARAAQKSVSRA